MSASNGGSTWLLDDRVDADDPEEEGPVAAARGCRSGGAATVDGAGVVESPARLQAVANATCPTMQMAREIIGTEVSHVRSPVGSQAVRRLASAVNETWLT